MVAIAVAVGVVLPVVCLVVVVVIDGGCGVFVSFCCMCVNFGLALAERTMCVCVCVGEGVEYLYDLYMHNAYESRSQNMLVGILTGLAFDLSIDFRNSASAEPQLPFLSPIIIWAVGAIISRTGAAT